MGTIPYKLIYDAAVQPVIDLDFAVVFALIIAAGAFCLFIGQRKYKTPGIVIFCIMITVGIFLMAVSIYHRAECKRSAQRGDYQVAEGVVENFNRVRQKGGKGASYLIETFTVQGVGFRCKSGIDVFNGGFHATNSPIQQGVQVKAAYKNNQIVKLWVVVGSGLPSVN